MSAPSSVEEEEAEETQDQVAEEETVPFGVDNQGAPLSEEACQEAKEDHQEAMEDPQVAEDLQATEDFQPEGIRERLSHDPLIVS